MGTPGFVMLAAALAPLLGLLWWLLPRKVFGMAVLGCALAVNAAILAWNVAPGLFGPSLRPDRSDGPRPGSS